MKQILSTLLIVILSFCISCHAVKNPCSLSENIIRDFRKEDSLLLLPLVKERDQRFWETFYEPSMFHSTNETYRFSINGSFRPTEIYKLEEKKDKYIFTSKVFDREFAKSDTLYSFQRKEISKELWTKFKSALDKYNFWTYAKDIDRKGLDGEEWLLEGYKTTEDECTHQKYHSIGRWSPIDTTFIKMCKLFIELKNK